MTNLSLETPQPVLIQPKQAKFSGKATSSRTYIDQFAAEAAAATPAGSLVLDAGAGHCPYRSLFAHTIYESADFCQLDTKYYDNQITHVCLLTDIPVEDGRYDLVFSSQTLEHVPEPKQVLQELHRVLKPGGQLWLSAPLFYAEHEVPYDFYRYTRYGFTYLLESTGFTVQKVEWLEGYYGALAYQLELAERSLPRHPRHYGGGIVGTAAGLLSFVLRPLFGGLAGLFNHLDLRSKYVSAGLCKNYAVIATKNPET
jgi:SAM-dependent methyltransferase